MKTIFYIGLSVYIIAILMLGYACYRHLIKDDFKEKLILIGALLSVVGFAICKYSSLLK